MGKITLIVLSDIVLFLIVLFIFFKYQCYKYKNLKNKDYSYFKSNNIDIDYQKEHDKQMFNINLFFSSFLTTLAYSGIVAISNCFILKYLGYLK